MWELRADLRARGRLRARGGLRARVGLGQGPSRNRGNVNIVKKCDRSYHKPGSNKGCAAETCQHTCEPGQVAGCAHKWTVRYSVASRQREQSFTTLDEAQTFQLTLSTGKRAQGAMFTDPRAGIAKFTPLADAFIEGMARASAKSKATYRSNFANPAVAKLLRDRSVVEVARMDGESRSC
jgi:hypothetical protein